MNGSGLNSSTFHAPFFHNRQEHHGTNHGGHTGGIAYALHAGFLVGLLVTVVIYIVGTLFAIPLVRRMHVADRMFRLRSFRWSRTGWEYGIRNCSGTIFMPLYIPPSSMGPYRYSG